MNFNFPSSSLATRIPRCNGNLLSFGSALIFCIHVCYFYMLNRDRSSRCMDVVQVMSGGSWGSSSTGVLLSDVFSNEMVHFSLFRIQVLYVLLGFKFVLHRVPSSSYNTPVFAPFIIKIRTEYSIQVRIITLSSGLAAFIIKILQDYCIAVQENSDDNYYGSSVDSCIVRTYVIHLAQGVKMVVYFFLQLERQLL